jgi:hypothetical protein
MANNKKIGPADSGSLCWRPFFSAYPDVFPDDQKFRQPFGDGGIGMPQTAGAPKIFYNSS